MFEREKKIIEMLKAAHSKIVKYRDNWIKFLRKVRLLEKKGLYEQEKFLIKQQIKKTRKGLIFIIQTRRSLTAIRSIIAISYRMERNMQKSSDNLALLIKIRKEYRKISYIIDRLRDTEQTLKRVLYYLNVKYHRLNKRSEQL